MKEKYFEYYEIVVFFCIAITLAAQTVYDNNISKILVPGKENIGYILGFFASLGLFYLLFTLLLYLYRVYFWKLFHKNQFIGGNWSGIITKFRGEEATIHVDLTIMQTYKQITFKATNYNDENKKYVWSTWVSTDVFFRDSCLEVFWQAWRENGDHATGNLQLLIKSPDELAAMFRDDEPSKSNGKMEFFKIKKLT